MIVRASSARDMSSQKKFARNSTREWSTPSPAVPVGSVRCFVSDKFPCCWAVQRLTCDKDITLLTSPNEPGLQQYNCMVAVYTFQQIKEMNEGCHMHRLGFFAVLSCACKTKSHILCNATLRSLVLRKIESTLFGVQFFLSSCRARSRLRRSSKRFVFDWLFPHVGE